MNLTISNNGFQGNINNINTKLDDVNTSITLANEYGEVSLPINNIVSDNGDLYIKVTNNDIDYTPSVEVTGPNYYNQQLVPNGVGEIDFGPISKEDYEFITVNISPAI